jgi:hypothetical protein
LEEERRGIDRRTFLRRAAVTGAAAAWAAPVIQTIAARPAFATNGTPAECRHSVGPWFTGGVQQNVGAEDDGGCMQACKNATGCDQLVAAVDPPSDPCQQVCDAACPNVSGSDDRICCDGSFCESNSWCVTDFGQGQREACYTGNATCSPVTCARNF